MVPTTGSEGKENQLDIKIDFLFAKQPNVYFTTISTHYFLISDTQYITSLYPRTGWNIHNTTKDQTQRGFGLFVHF